MSKRITIASALLGLLAATLTLLLVVASPALAHHNDEHTKGGGKAAAGDEGSVDAGDKDGDADSDPNTAYDEDNDANDGDTPNNEADEGDNAHPSGKDRSVENGGSNTQGKSESNPDDSKGPMRYEGELGDDKANGPGGTDLADQDGNNGCGNDDDFNDDNNGHCGKPTEDSVEPTPPTPPCDKDNNMANGVQPCDDDDVEGDNEGPCDEDNNMANGVQPCDDDVVNPVVPVCDKDNNMANGIQRCDRPNVVLGDAITRPATPEVLGTRVVRSPALAGERNETEGAVLPFTGASLAAFVLAGLGLIGAGFTFTRLRKN